MLVSVSWTACCRRGVWPRKHRKQPGSFPSIADESRKSRPETPFRGTESIASCGVARNDGAMAKDSAVPPIARVTTAATHPKGTLAATILGSSLAFIDGSVVNVALPAIERDLASSGASGASIGWLINAYLLTLGALVLVGGVAGDRYGRKRMFLAGIAVFTAASLGCALAPGFGMAARRARAARRRRCAPGAGEPRDPRCRFRGRSARTRGRDVGGGERDHRRARPARRRLARRRGRLAGDLPHQPADRRRRRVALVAPGRREPERRCGAARSRRRSARDRGPRPRDVRAHRARDAGRCRSHPRQCARRRRRARCRSARAGRVLARRGTSRPARDDAARAVRHQTPSSA